MPDVSVDGGKTWRPFDLDTMTADDAIAVEDAAGLTWLEFVQGLAKSSPKAWRALAWVTQRGDMPDLKITDVEFVMADFDIRHGAETVPLSEVSESSSDDTESLSMSSTESDPGSGTD